MNHPATRLYVGLVESNKVDQDGCISVKIPALGATFAARLVSQLAGDSRGTVLLPEKNDQVLVATDSGNTVQELSGEGNNIGTTALSVALSPYADLRVDSVTTVTRVIGDPAPITVSWTVTQSPGN